MFLLPSFLCKLTQACAVLKTVVNGTLYLQIKSFQSFCNMCVRHAMILIAPHII